MNIANTQIAKRMRKRTARLLIGLVLTALVAGECTTAQEPSTLSGKPLVQALRAGGHNLYFRHAATDWSTLDDVREAGDWESCDRTQMRQLSDEGRQAARDVGVSIRALDIPVGLVFASPYCRTVETAELMKLGPVETTTDVMNLRAAEYFGGRAGIVERARVRLATPPAAGTNTIFVAHGNVAREATPVYPGEGEGLAFRPDAVGGFVFVGRLTPEQWIQLAEELR